MTQTNSNVNPNQLNSGSIDTLTAGQTLLVRATRCKAPSQKIQLEFAEKKSANASTLLALMNKGDERFESKATRAYMSVVPETASAFLGIDLTATANWVTMPKKQNSPEICEGMNLNILNPTIAGERIRVQVIETVEPNDYQLEQVNANNAQKVAKMNPKTNEFITYNGQLIFMNKEIIDLPQGEEPADVILPSDQKNAQVSRAIKASQLVQPTAVASVTADQVQVQQPTAVTPQAVAQPQVQQVAQPQAPQQFANPTTK